MKVCTFMRLKEGRVGQKENSWINEAQLKVSGLSETKFNCFL